MIRVAPSFIHTLGMTTEEDRLIAELLDDVVDRLYATIKYKKPGWLDDKPGGPQINQTAVADETGVSQSTIGRLFNKKHVPSLHTLAAIAVCLDMQLPDLFGDILEKRSPYTTLAGHEPTIFDRALHELSETQLEWVTDRIDKMLTAKDLLREDPELYELIYGDINHDQRREYGRSIGAKTKAGQKRNKAS